MTPTEAKALRGMLLELQQCPNTPCSPCRWGIAELLKMVALLAPEEANVL